MTNASSMSHVATLTLLASCDNVGVPGGAGFGRENEATRMSPNNCSHYAPKKVFPAILARTEIVQTLPNKFSKCGPGG